MERISGKDATEVLGKHPLEIFPFLRETGILEALEKVLEDGRQTQKSFFYELPDTGVSGWASDMSAPLRDDSGKIIGVLSLIRDITAQKRAEIALQEQERKYRGLVQTVQEGIWTIDSDGFTTLVNPKLAEMLGYEAEEMMGKSAFSFLTPESKEEAEERFTHARNGINDKFELNLQKKNGESMTALLATTSLYDKKGRFNGSLGAVMDISDLKKAQEELEMEKERAEESDRLKSAFLANMSHEIRTPLNAIIGFIDLVLLDTSISREVKEYLESAKQGGNDLLRLMDDIIDLAKLETGQMSPNSTEFSPVTVLDNVAERGKSLIRESGKEIELIAHLEDADDILLKNDPERIEQMLMYIMENAVKFTDSGRIELGVSVTGERRLEIYVQDTGIGVPADAQPYVFYPFRQADEKESREFSGLGLGLSIAQKLSTLLGGYIRLDSAPGEGTVVYSCLPGAKDSGKR